MYKRQVYPAARLLWVYGLMDEDFIPAVQEAVAIVRADDPKVDLLLLLSLIHI